jgi:type II secretory pathway component GspD/PulD (secretin)
VKGSTFDLRFVNVGQLVDLLYGDVMRVPHVIDSDVLADTRQVSFRYDDKKGDLRAFVKVFLDSMGFAVQTRDGVDFITRKPADQARPDIETLVYHPKFRTAEYLSSAVQPLISGRVSAVSSLAGSAMTAAPFPASGIAASSAMPSSLESAPLPRGGASASDDFVFAGSAADVRLLRGLLPQLDTQPGEVVVRGWVYEVSNTDARNNAFSIAAQVLGAKVGISNGSTASDSSALTFSSHLLDVAVSALDADTRFKEISDPHVRVVSGQRVSLNVGARVPTLGSVSYQGQSGTPVQSVDYQDAGVIFTVQPVVLGDVIRLQLQEQISSFVPTTSGVNGSPTKNTRQMDTTVSLKDGEVVVLGGLVQDSESVSNNHEWWLPHFLDGSGGSKGRTEVLLVLQVQKV